MKLEEQVISLELAKRLKVLGVEQTAFWSWYETTDRDDTPRLNRSDESCLICTLPKQPWEEKYSAFTVAELGELLPAGHVSEFGLDATKIAEWICYHTDLHRYKDTVPYGRGKTEAEARAQMLVWLREQGT